MTTNDNKISLGSHENILLSTEDQVICAETLQALHFVQCNYSFGSNKVSNVFKQMFPDSKTAQSYKQEETKIEYVI